MATDAFGTIPDGHVVRRVTLGAAPGPVLEVLDLGARVHRLEVPGRDGERHDVVRGLPDPAAYLASTEYEGATVGRYANRIAGGRFTLDGREVRLDPNDGEHHLHGGTDGFDRRPWDLVDTDDRHAVLRLVSPAGDQGYPGELTAEVRFEVLADRVRVLLTATTDAATVVNLTSHAYLDLGPAAMLSVAAGRYLPVDDAGIPTDGPTSVAGTPYDVRAARPVDELDLDHCYVVDGAGLRTAAVLASEERGLRLEVRTDQPGLQVYTGNPRGGIALEPQRFPDSPHHGDFPSAVLRPGASYRSVIEWVGTP